VFLIEQFLYELEGKVLIFYRDVIFTNYSSCSLYDFPINVADTNSLNTTIYILLGFDPRDRVFRYRLKHGSTAWLQLSSIRDL